MLEFLDQNYIQIVFIVCALMGGVMHWLKKFVKKETTVKLHEWFGTSDLATTLYTVTVFFFAIVGAIAADIVNSQTGFWAAMYSGFVTGFAIDSGFNSDGRSPSANLVETRQELRDLLGEVEKAPAAEKAPKA